MITLEIFYFIQIFTSIIFLFSSVSKLFTLSQFINVFQSLGFNKTFSLFCAISTFLLEFSVSVFIVFKSTVSIGMIILILLIFAFLGTTIYSQIKSLKIKCNCFGNLMEDNLGKSTYYRIFFLLILFFSLTFSQNYIGITEISDTITINFVLSSINLMLFYFLFNAFGRLILMNRTRNI
ncbi:MauE/DoxX family redox-associated membrane protein [Heyndrickxia shackletonii]|uniref:MauE/DoxX family redox-associated membrane protein n=1 Tax=Heyndrickxia shackletonii TaxID=157838 RepID=UPI0034622E7E